MTEVSASHHQIEVRVGRGEPTAIRMMPGEQVGPIALGTQAGWRIEAAGVAEEHGYLYFDGTDVFLQSTSLQNPVRVNGQPIPCEWIPIFPPCDISLGSAELWFGPAEADDFAEITTLEEESFADAPSVTARGRLPNATPLPLPRPLPAPRPPPRSRVTETVTRVASDIAAAAARAAVTVPLPPPTPPPRPLAETSPLHTASDVSVTATIHEGPPIARAPRAPFAHELMDGLTPTPIGHASVLIEPTPVLSAPTVIADAPPHSPQGVALVPPARRLSAEAASDRTAPVTGRSGSIAKDDDAAERALGGRPFAPGAFAAKNDDPAEITRHGPVEMLAAVRQARLGEQGPTGTQLMPGMRPRAGGGAGSGSRGGPGEGAAQPAPSIVRGAAGPAAAPGAEGQPFAPAREAAPAGPATPLAASGAFPAAPMAGAPHERPGAPTMPLPAMQPPPSAPASVPGLVAQPGGPTGFGAAPGGAPGFAPLTTSMQAPAAFGGAMQPGAGFPGPAAPGSVPGSALVPPGASPAKPRGEQSWALQRWREASMPQRAIFALLPFTLMSVWVLFGEEPPEPEPPPKKPAQAASAQTAEPKTEPTFAASTQAPDPTGDPDSMGAPPMSAGAVPASTTASGSPPPIPSTAGTAPPFQPRPAAAALAGMPNAPRPVPGGKTLQREAADAAAIGDYARATDLYEQLAREHPDVPAFAEAARIMRVKATPR